MKHNFEQTIDTSRPHTLLTLNPKQSGQLVYRYDDTQETVIVPNIWYNQGFKTRVAVLRWEAQLKTEAADKFKRNPTRGISQAVVNQIVDRYLDSASKLRTEADQMEAAGSETHPVAASQSHELRNDPKEILK